MKIADKNELDINNIYGSWAGAMGHFQFIPTTLSQYGIDGNGDNRVDIINSVGDAMFSAANYLHHLLFCLLLLFVCCLNKLDGVRRGCGSLLEKTLLLYMSCKLRFSD